ncbi:phage tail tape measure protein [Phocaeicola sp. KGMB11183]|uniref:Phage tail tape measure protein n=1 Tax=Phocaeicola acetigenes TaxID=3016083 RepID=A0ABT4PFY2_9BACT|nr:phage tail tape measure protein [Phocaeicola sp. KGMB11183]MCZ8371906.1 phage tail tape measure protein [Phocaeicola sp. KGMB11183]
MAIDQVATVEVRVNGEEAKQELKDLEKYATSLKGQLADAHKVGDTATIKKLTSELRKTETQIKTLKKDTTALTEVMNNLDKATPKELRATLAAINKQLNSGYIKRGSAEWKYYQQQAKLVTAELQKIKLETQETTSWLDRMNNGLTKWGGMIATAAAALTGVSFTINKLRSNRDDKEEAQAELKALTGLDDESIAWLTRQAEILSTSMEKSGLRIRQSSDEILQAYMLIGSKKPELLGNKEALNAVTVEAMRLATAAKIDLRDAVTATTISLNMYGESADQAAKYVNVLAAGSKEGAADVASQAAAIKNAGVAAATAGVPIEGLQGAIQTLAEKGVEAEVAGTALKKFFLVLQTGPDETNPKVVGLQTALENLNSKGMSAGEIQKMFGEEAYSAASILIQNVDAVDRYTQAVTGTNIAVEQAAINSDTNRAKLEQHKNAIKEAGIELAERLNPSIMTLTSLTTKVITILPRLIDFAIEYRSVIISSTAAIVAYSVAVNTATIKTKLYDTWTKVATASTSAFNKVLKLNPAGLVIGGIVALGTYLITKLVPNTDKATEAQRRYNEELERTQEELKRYQNIEDRFKNINNLNDRQKQALKQDAQSELAAIEDKLTQETIAYQKYYAEQKKLIMERTDVDEGQRQALLKSLNNQVEEKTDELEYLLQREKTLKDIIASIPEQNKVNTTEGGIEDSQNTSSAVEVASKAETARYYDELLQLKKSYLDSDSMTQKDYQALSEDLERQHLERMLAIVGLEPEKRQQIQDKLLEMRIKFKEECIQQDEQAAEEASEETFSRMEKQYQLEVQEATKRHFETLSSEEAYYQELADIQKRYYDEVLHTTQISEERKAEIQQRIERQSLEESEKNKQEYEAKLRKTVRLAQDIGSDFGSTFAELVADSEATMADYMKATVSLILDTLQKIMLASIAETQIKNISTFGFIGLAKAAAEIALITAAFETAKAAINGFEEGGYTGSGRHDEPKGIVHAGEFVANRYAVSNPSVRPVLDLIDRAQKNNTIGSLTAKDVSAVLSGVSSATNNTYYQQTVPIDNGMPAVMMEVVKVMGTLNKRLNEPIYTYTKATGKMGINEAQELVTKMKNNASRRLSL